MPKYRGTMFWSWVILTLLVGAARSESGVEPAKFCCSNQNTTMQGFAQRLCTEKNTIDLTCEGGGKYKYPGEQDETMELVVVGNRTFLNLSAPGEPDHTQIVADKYCLTTTKNTNESVALICFDVGSIEPSISSNQMFIGSASIISSIFMGLTLFVYLYLRELRELQDKALMSMVASYMVGYFLLGTQFIAPSLDVPTYNSNLACLISAFVMYYAFMCTFFWMHIVSLNIWRLVWLSKCKIRNDLLFIIYCLVGWGVPLILFALTFIAHHTDVFPVKPGFAESTCWFSSYHQKWIFFYGPMATLLIMNYLYLGMTGFRLWHQCESANSCRTKILKLKCQTLLKLALLMGITWIFEVLSFGFGSDTFIWFLGDIANLFQGVVIFFLLVVSRNKVRKLLAHSRPCGIRFPKSWLASPDIEECDVVAPDELELSDEEDLNRTES